MTVLARVWSQRDSGDADLRAHGCGTYALLSATDWATGGAVTPSSQAAADARASRRLAESGATMAEFRTRGLLPEQVATAWRAIEVTARVPFRAQVRHGVKVDDLLAPMQDDGTAAIVAVLYGVIQDGGKGVGSFRGGHWVFAFDPSSTAIRIADPLRRSVTSWPIDLLTHAMERFGDNRAFGGQDKSWGNDRGEAVAVWPTPTLLAQARSQRDAARKDVTALKAQVAKLKAQLGQGPVSADERAIAGLQALAADDLAVADKVDAIAKALRTRSTSTTALVATLEEA